MPINYIHIFEKSITLEFTVSGHRIKQFELIMNRLYFILLLLSSSLFLGAQNNDSTIFILSTDSNIENFDKYLSFRLNVNNDVEIFKVNSHPNNFLISPNTKLNTKLSISYRFISFSISFSPNLPPAVIRNTG